jgi:hypothetical protein
LAALTTLLATLLSALTGLLGLLAGGALLAALLLSRIALVLLSRVALVRLTRLLVVLIHGDTPWFVAPQQTTTSRKSSSFRII